MKEQLPGGAQRKLEYLRISVTDRCNLRCAYCLPEEGLPLVPREEILTYEEIALVARAAARAGVRHVRLTGGEPLVRPDLVRLVEQLAAIPGLQDLSLTTNGVLLGPLAPQLAAAGLRRVNVSLDSLRPERFRAITRGGELALALAGLEAARRAGLEPVKVNVVVMRGVNDDEILDFAARARTDGWHVRFIELMPIGAAAGQAERWFIPNELLKTRVEAAYGPLEPVALEGAGPARTYRLPGGSGSIGFISPLSEHFCSSCNRLRLTARGQLLPCLASPKGLELLPLLRRGASDDELVQMLQLAFALKGDGHHLGARSGGLLWPMSAVGG